MNTCKSVKDIAKMFDVHEYTIRRWLKDGLEFEKEKLIGRKARIVIDPQSVWKYHKTKEKMD